MAAAENKRTAIEDARLRIVSQIDGHAVEASLVVDILQTFLTDGYELGLVVGGARRFGIPLHTPRPEDVGLAVAHTVDGIFQLLVGVHWRMADKALIVLHAAKRMVAAVLRVAGTGYQTAEHLALQRLCPSLVALQLSLARLKDFPYD